MKNLMLFLLMVTISFTIKGQVDPDSIHSVICGASVQQILDFNRAYSNALHNNNNNNYLQTPNLPDFTLQDSFPANKIIRCGNFRLYYADFLYAPFGFADLSVGSTRRNTLCEVLNYISSIISIPSGDSLDLYIARSGTELVPAPQNRGYLAIGGPFFIDSTFGYVQGIYNGNLFNHILDNVDPDSLNYDGFVGVNFAIVDPSAPTGEDVINYRNDSAQKQCDSYDLYGLLVHSVTHALGWISGIKEDPNPPHYAESFNNSFSRLDSLYFYYENTPHLNGFDKLVVFNSSNLPIINPTIANINNIMRINRIWLNDNGAPINQPIGTSDHGFIATDTILGFTLSHLNMSSYSFSYMSQYSPGYQPIYLIGPYVNTNETKREYSLPELRIFNSMGFDFTNNFYYATNINGIDTNYLLLQNNPPYRTHFRNSVTSLYNISPLFPDTMAHDTLIVNYNTATDTNQTILQINIGNSQNFADLDNDSISIYPGSLFGIRGVSQNGNNHIRLTLNSAGTVIFYKPEPYYVGRSQFGFYLWDGHEKGAFVVYTVDVLAGTDSIVPNKELVINGTYEDGTEVKQRNSSYKYKPYTSETEHFLEGEFFGGFHLSGAHPFEQTSNHLSSYLGGGDYVEYSTMRCDEADSNSNFKYFGYWMNSSNYCDFSYTPFKRIPNPRSIPVLNDRFHKINTENIPNHEFNFITFTDSLRRCNKYIFKCDLHFPRLLGNGYQQGQNFKLLIDFTSNPLLNPPNTFVTYQSTSLTTSALPAALYDCDSIWKHFEDTIPYCSILPAKYARIRMPATPNTNANFVYIDNISFKLLEPVPMSLSIQAYPQLVYCGQSETLTALVHDSICPLTYHWSNGSHLKAITVTPPFASVYKVTVTNVCDSLTDSISVNYNSVPPTAVASYDQPVCTGGSLHLHADLSWPGSVYYWSGPFGYNTQGKDPIRQNANSSMNGIYFLTVTTGPGCSSTDSIIVSIDTATFLFGNPYYEFNCLGDTIFLYSSNGNAYHFWYGPDNFWSMDQNPIIPNGSHASSGYYYLMVENSAGCIDFDSVYVNTSFHHDLLLNTNAPLCKHDTLKLYSQTGSNYAWIGPQGFMSIQQNPVIVNADTVFSGTYYCYMYDSSGCHSADTSIEIFNCCSDTAIKLVSVNNISQISGSLPQEFAVIGDVNIDVNYNINPGSHIVMLPKSQFTIWSNVGLNIDNTHIEGCKQLWNSIYLRDSASLKLNRSHIEDAEYAITALNNPYLSITFNHFHRNYVGLYFPEPNPWTNLRTIGALTFSGNEFDCLNDVLFTPLAGQKSYAGALLYSNLSVSLLGTNTNLYHDMRNGIISYNTNLAVNNSQFYNLTSYGINSSSYRNLFQLTQTGFGWNAIMSFHDCQVGILSNRMNVKITDNYMTNMFYGISAVNSQISDLFIHKNKLHCSNQGIKLWMNDPVNIIDIDSNRIEIRSTPVNGAAAISMYDMFAYPPIKYSRVHDNYLIMDTCAYGIRQQCNSGTEVFNNIIRMKQPLKNNSGISVTNCFKDNIFCNDVFGISDSIGDTATLVPAAMRVTASTSTKFSCNSVDSTLVGLGVENGCLGDSIQGNVFTDHYYGLHYNQYAVTGSEFHKGNAWFGNFIGNGARHNGIMTVYNLSPYRAMMVPFYYFPPNPFPATGWFTATGTAPTFVCTICPRLDTNHFRHDTVYNSFDYSVATGVFTPEEFQEESNWIYSRYLFNKILADSMSTVTDYIMQNFYDSIVYVSPGKYQQVENLGKEAFQVEPLTSEYVAGLMLQIRILLDSLEAESKLLGTGLTLADSLQILLSNENLLSLLQTKQSQLQAALEGVMNIVNGKIDFVISQNGLLPSAEIYEQNEKSINDIYLNTIAKNIIFYSAEQLVQIYSIACQCPLAGGNAVYKARSLYALVSDTVFNDYLLCLEAGIKRDQVKDKISTENLFKLYPNPARNIVIIEWQIPSNENATLKIIDPLGQEVREYKFSLTGDTYQINTEKMTPGIYKVQIKVSDGINWIRKLIILK